MFGDAEVDHDIAGSANPLIATSWRPVTTFTDTRSHASTDEFARLFEALNEPESGLAGYLIKLTSDKVNVFSIKGTSWIFCIINHCFYLIQCICSFIQYDKCMLILSI